MSTPRIDFTIDDTAMTAESGQSVAAALIANGRRSWRRTRFDKAPRGVFCGIGICFDCLVTVNGRPNQRACLTELHQGDAISTQEGSGRDALTC